MIKCEISTEIVELAPNQTTEIQLILINKSQVIDHFTLLVEPVENPDSTPLDVTWVTLTPNTFSLRPGQQSHGGLETDSRQEIRGLITLPSGVFAGNYAGQIRINARSGPDNSAIIPLTLIVSELENQILELQPPELASRGGTGIFRINLANQGNATHLYPLYAENEEDNCRFEVNPPEIRLQPGERTNLTLRVQPRHRNWASDDKTYDFRLKLEGFPQEVPGRFTQRCLILPLYWLIRNWTRIAMAVVFLAALLVVALIFFFPQVNTKAALNCGPTSTRRTNLVVSNNLANILVSKRSGEDPMTRVASESAEILPGLFASLISVSADGRKLAYVTARNEAMDDAQIWVIDLETKQRQAVAVIPAGLWPHAPVWSTDGQNLVYFKRVNATSATSPTPLPSGTPSTVAPLPSTSTTDLTKLELWLVAFSKDPPEAPKVLKDAKINIEDLYGDPNSAICWNTDNKSLLVLSKSTTGGPLTIQSQVGLDGSVKAITPTALPLSNLGLISSFSFKNQLAMPLPLLPSSRVFNVPNNLTSAPSAEGGCPTKRPFSQNDPRWSDQPLRAGEVQHLSDYGCALVAAAILLNYYDISTTPNQLINNCLGSLASPLTQEGWILISTSARCSSNKLRGGVKGDFNWEDLDAALQKGPAIIGLLGGQTGQHFLVVTSGAKGEADSYRVTDPWDGSTYKTLNDFLSAGYYLRWLITYDGPGPNCNTGAQVNTPISIKTSGVDDGGLYRFPVNFDYEVLGASLFTSTLKTSQSRINPDQLPPVSLNSKNNTFSNPGFYNISIQATNAKSNQFAEQNIFFTIDQEPPFITHTILTQRDKSGKFLGPVTIQLIAQDFLSGVAKLEYQQDNQPEWRLYNSDTTSNPLIIRGEGSHTIRYRAEDGAGNFTQVNTIETFEISTITSSTPPTPTPTIPGGGSGGGGKITVAPTATSKPTVAPTQLPTNTPVAPPSTAIAPNKPVTTTTIEPAKPTTAVVLTNTPTPTKPTNTPLAISPTSTKGPAVGSSPVSNPTARPATVAPPTLAPTATPLPNPTLFVSVSQLVFYSTSDINTSKSFQISNKGSIGTLNWSLQPDNNTLISLSATSGTLLPGASTTVNVTLISFNINKVAQNININITSNGGNQPLQVVVSSQTLPFATFNQPTAEQLDAVVVPMTVVVQNQSTIMVKADYAYVYANYTDLNGNVVSTTIAAKVPIDASGTGNFSWNTASFPSQKSVSIRGVLYAKTTGTISTDIPLVSAVLPLSATIISPVNNSVLDSSTTISVTQSARVNHITFFYTYLNSPPITLPNKAATPNWQAVWDTTAITPTISTQLSGDGSSGVTRNLVQLRGLICSSTTDDPLFCKNIVLPVTNLTTAMTATVTTDLSPNTTLSSSSSGITKTFTISGASPNVNHVSLYSSYSDAAVGATRQTFWLSGRNQIARKQSDGTLPVLNWDFLGVPPQSNISVSAYACYTADEKVCYLLAGSPYKNLTLASPTPATPFTLSTENNRAIIATTNFLQSPFQVTVRDANGLPVSGGTVTFKVSNATYASFVTTSGPQQSVAVTTTSSGIATSPQLLTSSIANSNNSYTVTADADGTIFDWLLYNKSINTTSAFWGLFGGNNYYPIFSPGNSIVNTAYPTDTLKVGIRHYTPPTYIPPSLLLPIGIYIPFIKNIDLSFLSTTNGPGIKFSSTKIQKDDGGAIYGAAVTRTYSTAPIVNGSKVEFLNTDPPDPVTGVVNNGIPIYYYPFPTFVSVNGTTNCSAGNIGILAFSGSGIAGYTNYSIIPNLLYNYQPAVFNFKNSAGTPKVAKLSLGVDNQSATVNTSYTKRFQASILDACGNRVTDLSGTQITFEASGGGTFEGGSQKVTFGSTDLQNNYSMLTAPRFTANGTPGNFTVQVMWNGNTLGTFKLENLP